MTVKTTREHLLLWVRLMRECYQERSKPSAAEKFIARQLHDGNYIYQYLELDNI